MPRRLVFALPALLLPLVVACGGGDGATPATSSTMSTTTVAAITSSTSSTSTTTSTSTSTTTSTTTTIPVPQGLDIRADGIGDALFGASPDDVVAYVEAVLGPPTADSDWLDPVATAIPCTGTAVRFVTWHDLTLQFTDESAIVAGLRHFVSYSYGPSAEPEMPDPYGLQTDGGITLGATVNALREAHPTTEIVAGDDVVGDSYLIEEGLGGFLTGTKGSSTVISFVGGQACGE